MAGTRYISSSSNRSRRPCRPQHPLTKECLAQADKELEETFPPSSHFPVFGLCQPEASQPGLSTTASHNKLPVSIILPTDSIEYDTSHPVDASLKAQIASSVKAPWGKLMIPIVVSKLDTPHDGKQWLLRDGLHRLLAAEEIGLPEIRAIVVEGTEDEIRLIAHELDMVRKHPSKYEEMRELAGWHELVQHIYPAYKTGGDKKKS